MSEISEKCVAYSINKCFEREGLPKQIKIDNGVPLVTPVVKDIPTLTVLWWIGLGIKVIYNRPSCPQQNGTVEGLQGTIKRWAEPSECSNELELQNAVNEAIRIQRNVYEVSRNGYKTRAELYPELKTNPRKYSLKLFDYNKVKEYLVTKIWQRKVSKIGCVRIFGEEIYVALGLKGQLVTITFDKDNEEWMIKRENGSLVKTSKKGVFTEKTILDFVNEDVF